MQQKVFIRPGLALDPADIKIFAGKTLCLPLGEAIAPRIMELVKSGDMRVQAPPDFFSCAKMVAAGHADLFVTDVLAGRQLLQDTVLTDKVLELDKSVESSPLYVLFTRADPHALEVMARFNAAVAQINAKTLPKPPVN